MRMVRNSVDPKRGFDLTALQIFGSIVALLFTAAMNDARALADRHLPFERSIITEVTQELIGEKNRMSRPARTEKQADKQADKQCGLFGSERRANDREVEKSPPGSTCRIPMGE